MPKVPMENPRNPSSTVRFARRVELNQSQPLRGGGDDDPSGINRVIEATRRGIPPRPLPAAGEVALNWSSEPEAYALIVSHSCETKPAWITVKANGDANNVQMSRQLARFLHVMAAG